jgi:hypothetical protein
MGEEKIHSLYLQRKDTSSHGPSIYCKDKLGHHGLHINPNNNVRARKSFDRFFWCNTLALISGATPFSPDIAVWYYAQKKYILAASALLPPRCHRCAVRRRRALCCRHRR